MRRSRLATPVIVMAIATAAVGCSSGGGLTPRPSGHATTSASPSASASPATVLNGVQLSQILDNISAPAGWKVGKGESGGAYNSGSMLTPMSPPVKGNDNCNDLNTAAQGLSFIQWWSVSYAGVHLTYPSEPANLPQVGLTIGGYQPGDALKVIPREEALIRGCHHSFHDKSLSNELITTSMRSIPHLGDQNLFLTSVQPVPATKYIPASKTTAQVLLVRVGNYIAGVDTNTASAGNVRPATVQGFGGLLVQLLQSHSLG